jgi:hypothetical protein
VSPEATVVPLVDVITVYTPAIGVPPASTDFTVRGTELGTGFERKDTIFEKSPERAPYGLGSVALVT